MLVCVIHADFSRIFQIGFEGVLPVSAAVPDNAVDFFQLRGIVPGCGDGFLVGVQNDTHVVRSFLCDKKQNTAKKP